MARERLGAHPRWPPRSLLLVLRPPSGSLLVAAARGRPRAMPMSATKRFSLPLALTGLLLVPACGQQAAVPAEAPAAEKAVTPMPETSAPTTAASAPADERAALAELTLDPVALAMSADGVRALCAVRLGKAEALRQQMRALSTKPDEALTYDTVLAQLDALNFEVGMAGGFTELMHQAHPDDAVRDAAGECRPNLDKFLTDLMLDAELAGVVERYAKRGEPLDGTRKRLLADSLRDFRRNGLALPPAGQAELRALNAEVTKLEQEFSTNLAEAVGTLRVPKEKLKGLSEAFLQAHPADAEGLVTLTTNYPDYFPVLKSVEDRAVARDLALLFENRAADKNIAILERVLALREKKATLLGYSSWAAYALEPRMAKTTAAVQSFLTQAATTVKAPAKREFAEFQKKYKQLGLAKTTTSPIPTYDRLYLETALSKDKFELDSAELSKYFEVNQVTKGLLELVARLYGLDIRESADLPRWHSEVRVFEFFDKADGHYIGRIYLDLHPRDGKYKHAAMFDIRSGRRLPDGTYLPPMAALVTNFQKSAPGAPGLLDHSDVTTYFHEFGHALHHVLTQQELASYAGTHTATDFVEAPSQMFEEWAWRRETLDLFARHHETGAAIPPALFESLQRSRAFGRALATERQISLATLDFEYHSQKTPFDTDKVLASVLAKTQSFSPLPGTHFQATFGHLMGYDAGYYGYQWALAMARDVLTRFDAEGYLNPEVARDWRTLVLSKGAGAEEGTLISDFLGRKTNLDAYGRFLSGK